MGERPDVCSVLTAQNKTVGILTCVECEHIITHTHAQRERIQRSKYDKTSATVPSADSRSPWYSSYNSDPAIVPK